MSDVPEGLYYTKEHEWMRVEGDTVTIGITDHAQYMLTEIVYIELPEEGDAVGDMGEFAVVESVKSASPIFAPLAGTITAVNMELEDAPELQWEPKIASNPGLKCIQNRFIYAFDSKRDESLIFALPSMQNAHFCLSIGYQNPSKLILKSYF